MMTIKLFVFIVIIYMLKQEVIYHIIQLCIEKLNESKDENKKYLIIPKKFSESKLVKIFQDPDK